MFISLVHCLRNEEKIMELEEIYGKNRISLKNCQRVYNLVALTYIFVYGGSLFGSLYSCILMLSSLLQILNALFLAAILAAGFMGAYLKSDLFAIGAPVIAAINAPISPNLGYFGVPLTVGLALGTVLANKKYKWLEKQEGFPYFNVRFTNQKFDQVQFGIKDPYTQKLEELRKKDNNSGHMDEI